ncbi:MAG: hypothetical protein ACKO9F_11445, partial [Caldilinea sp.]
MSGILLPGKDKKPSASGGIELPKGFARRRETSEIPAEPAPEEAAPEAAPEAPLETAPAQPERRRRPGENLLF